MATGLEFRESQLSFHFGETVEVARYDEQAIHKKMTGQIAGTKGVDFLVCGDRLLALIEVKNQEGGRGTKTHQELVDDVAQKLRDTLAGTLIVALQRSGAIGERLARELGPAMGHRDRPGHISSVTQDFDVYAVLWIETRKRVTGGPKKARVHLDFLTKSLKPKLSSWFPGKILVLDREVFLEREAQLLQKLGLKQVLRLEGDAS